MFAEFRLKLRESSRSLNLDITCRRSDNPDAYSCIGDLNSMVYWQEDDERLPGGMLLLQTLCKLAGIHQD